MNVPLVCVCVWCMRSVCVLCTEMKHDEGMKGENRCTHGYSLPVGWLAWTLKRHFCSSIERAGSRGTGLQRSKSHCVLITLMKNTWHVFILYLALKQFSNFTSINEQNTLRRLAKGVRATKKMLDMPNIGAERLSESFSIAIHHWLCQQVYSCASNGTLNDEWMSGISDTNVFSQSQACVRVEFSSCACNMTCHRYCEHLIALCHSPFEMIKSISWQLQIEFYMLNILTYWRVTAYQPFIMLMNWE